MFSFNHILWILLSAAFAYSLVLMFLRVGLKKAGMVMCGISILSEGSKILSDMVPSTLGGMHLDPQCLPFHLCSMLLFVVFYITFSEDCGKRQAAIDFTSVMGTMGSILAILIPTNGTEFNTVYPYQCFVYHAGLLAFSLYLIVGKKARLGRKAMVRNIVIILVLEVIAIYINGLLATYDTNFLYVVRPPMENLPILNLSGGWHMYFMKITLLGLLAIVLFHLPFVLKERRQNGSDK